MSRKFYNMLDCNTGTLLLPCLLHQAPSGAERFSLRVLAGGAGLEVAQVISAGGEQVDGLVLRFQGGVERVFLEEAEGFIELGQGCHGQFFEHG